MKVLSPGTLVAKRFFRNRIAVTGLVILAFMFIFSFIGGLVSPYKEDQKFYRYDIQQKTYAGVIAVSYTPLPAGGSDVLRRSAPDRG